MPNARYYNVQLFRGKTKILSAWPIKPTLTLQTHWTYAKAKYRLAPGVYHWYVWPGFGPRPDAKYGAMLGTRPSQSAHSRRTAVNAGIPLDDAGSGSFSGGGGI